MIKKYVILWIILAVAQAFAVLSFVGAISTPYPGKTFIVDHESMGRVHNNIAMLYECFDCDKNSPSPYRKTFNQLASKKQEPLSCNALVRVSLDDIDNQITLHGYTIIACGSCRFGFISDGMAEGSSLLDQRMVINRFVDTVLKDVPYKTSSDIMDTLTYIHVPLVLWCSSAFILFIVSVIVFVWDVVQPSRKDDAANAQL